MGTKKMIQEQGRVLFNQHGILNVTLRDIAKALNKSYGNLTYHYPTKEDLVLALYHEMNGELTELQLPESNRDLLSYFMSLPSVSYDISLKYLFLTVDFVEIKRNFPKVYAIMTVLQEERQLKWLKLLNQLHTEGFLKDSLSEEDLRYIMLLSASIRTSYFQFQSNTLYSKTTYSKTVNQLLKYYLSDKGRKVYHEFEVV